MKITYFLITVVFLTTCATDMQNDNIDYQIILNGSDVSAKISSKQKELFENEIFTLLKNTSEKLRVHFSEERISELKKSEDYIEIIYKQEKVFKSDSFGKFSIRRLLIPLSGDLYGSEKDPVITIFIGDEEGYFTGPFRNKTGLETVKNIYRSLTE